MHDIIKNMPRKTKITSYVFNGGIIAALFFSSVLAVDQLNSQNDPRGYYRVLGVSKNADQKQIEKAFRKLAMEWHPDRQTHKSDEQKAVAAEKFKKLAEAKDVLSNIGKRRKYDITGDGSSLDATEKAIDKLLTKYNALHTQGIYQDNEGKTLFHELLEIRSLIVFLKAKKYFLIKPDYKNVIEKTVNLMYQDKTILMCYAEEKYLNEMKELIKVCPSADPFKQKDGKNVLDVLLSKHNEFNNKEKETFKELVNIFATSYKLSSKYYENDIFWENLTWKNRYLTPRTQSVLIWGGIGVVLLGYVVYKKHQNKKQKKDSEFLLNDSF